MKKVKFRFSIDQKVKTIFGKTGFVDMQGVDGAGRCYFVKSAVRGQWFKEHQLKERKKAQ